MVQELIQTVKATTGSAELLPDLEHVALIPNGDVVAMPGSPEPAHPGAACRGDAEAADRRRAGAAGAGAVRRAETWPSRRSTTRWRSFRVISRSSSAPAAGRTSSVWWVAPWRPSRRSRADEELQRLKDRASEVTQVMAPPEFLQQQKKAQDGPDRVGGGHRRRHHRRWCCGCGRRRALPRRPPPQPRRQVPLRQPLPPSRTRPAAAVSRREAGGPQPARRRRLSRRRRLAPAACSHGNRRRRRCPPHTSAGSATGRSLAVGPRRRRSAHRR